MGVVVDASALAKVFLNEEHASALRRYLHRAVAEERDLLAPGLVRYEMGSIVSAHLADEPLDEQARVLEDTLTLVRTVPLEDPGRVLRFVPDTGSFYDAAYLWVARREDARLLTYDSQLARAAEVHDVAVVQPGVGGKGA